MKTLFNLSVIIILICTIELPAQIKNGDFELGNGKLPDFWTTSSWISDGVVFTWENGTGIGGSKCISIENTKANDSRWIQNLTLKPNSNYIITGYVKGENIVNHQSGNIFANFSILNTWDLAQIHNSTYNWQLLKLCFSTDGNGNATIALRLGYFWNVVTGKVWFDNLTITETENFGGLTKNEGKFIYTLLEENDLVVITETNMTRWIDHLDSAYIKYAELVGFQPFNGEKIEIRSVSEYPGGWAIAGNPILWYQPYIKQELKTVNDLDNWSFGIMHELGHDFDHPSWNYEGEHLANFKMIYVLEELNGTIYLDNKYYIGNEIKKLYKDIYLDKRVDYEKTGNLTYNGDCLSHLLGVIQDSIGWKPFKDSYRHFRDYPHPINGRLKKFQYFLDCLSIFSGKDVRKFISKTDRDLLVFMLNGHKGPYSVNQLSAINRDCKSICLQWQNVTRDVYEIHIERRTKNTWFKNIHTFLNTDTIWPDMQQWNDSTVNADSTYYYRLRVKNNKGLSAYTTEVRTLTPEKNETPEICPSSYSLCQAETINMTWHIDTTSEGEINLMFFSNNLARDSLFIIKNIEKFDRKLNIETFINNQFDSSNIYIKLLADFSPGYWKFEIDSLYSSNSLLDSVFQFTFTDFTFPFQSWICTIKGVGSIERNINNLNIKLDKHYFGHIQTIYQAVNTCCFQARRDTFTININRKFPNPGCIKGPTIICEGSQGAYKLPGLLKNQKINWSVSPENLAFHTIKDDSLFLHPDIGFSGKLYIHSFSNNNCNMMPFHDSLLVTVKQKPVIELNHNKVICKDDSLVLLSWYPKDLMINWISAENKKFITNDTTLEPIVNNTVYRYFLQDSFNCRSDTGQINFHVTDVISDFTTNKTQAYVNENIQFVNLCENADKYKWYFGDGSVSSENNPKHFYSEKGEYSIGLIAKHSIEKCSDSIFLPNYITIIDVVNKKNSNIVSANTINIYPVPGKDDINIEFKYLPRNITRIDVFNSIGREVYSTKEIQKHMSISLRNVPSGPYYLKFICAENIVTKKFVKQ